MCVNPLKGFVNKRKQIVAVSRKHNSYIFDGYKLSPWNGSHDNIPAKAELITNYIDLPCRKCVECIAIQKKEWTIRAIAEAQLHSQMCFITLTYDNEHLPISNTIDDDGVNYSHPTLKYSDFQNFMKRLRYEYKDRKIRYLVCGEYGSHTFRPHYHAIIYGISIDDFRDLRVHSRTRDGNLLYKSDILNLNLWTHGFCLIGDCTSATCGYVAGYVDKKNNTFKDDNFYVKCGLTRPFIKSSNRPGLGALWFEKNKDRFKSTYDYLSVSNGLSDPTKIYLTENWKKKYDAYMHYNGKEMNEIIAYQNAKLQHRIDFYDCKLENEMLNTDRSKTEYLTEKSYLKETSLKKKVRDLM